MSNLEDELREIAKEEVDLVLAEITNRIKQKRDESSISLNVELEERLKQKT